MEALTVLARLLRVDGERATAKTGISQAMAAVLGRLRWLPDETTVSELARSLECNMGNLSGTLDRLEEGGYVERLVGESDRRARFVRLTPKGRRMIAVLLEKFRNGRVFSVLRHWSVEQLKEFTEIINELNSAAK